MTIAQSLVECFSCLCWNVLLEDVFPGEQPFYFCQTKDLVDVSCKRGWEGHETLT